MAYIFLSHSHADKLFVRKLAADLRLNGHSVWIDEAEIKIGDSLIKKITEGLEQVDYVCAILSKVSVDSAWVQKELDIANNREIAEKRVIVLPLLIAEVDPPAFFKGKFIADFRDEARYAEVFQLLLRSVGGGEKARAASAEEIELLREALRSAHAQVEASGRAVERAGNAAFRAKSERLRQKIFEANRKFPSHAPINNTYAFEACGIPVTLDYLLWAIAKADRRGGHPLDHLISLDNKWDDVSNMLEAYEEMLGRQ